MLSSASHGVVLLTDILVGSWQLFVIQFPECPLDAKLVAHRRGGMICDVISYPPSSLEDPPSIFILPHLSFREGCASLAGRSPMASSPPFPSLVSWGGVNLFFQVWESIRWQVMMSIRGTPHPSFWPSIACKVKSYLSKVGIPSNLSFS